MRAPLPILQFGTSRFLQAHADLFISEALARGEAVGHVAVVQTTSSPESAARIAALAGGASYPVRIRGLRNGEQVDEETQGRAIRQALQAERDWKVVRRIAVEDAQIILSNTGDRGYQIDPRDGSDLACDFDKIPRSYPAKLTMLLLERWMSRPEAPLSIFPCELVSRNGDQLRDIVCELAREWDLPAGFNSYVRDRCRWANSLVDRIVSEPIRPVGAVAEPYALWAIERQAGLVLPCRHEVIIVTDNLAQYERFKLCILNLGHSFLAERWLAERRPAEGTVFSAMNDPALRQELEAVWSEEVLPVFAAEGLGPDAEAYIGDVRERFLNPFLKHRLSDIAQNHREKKLRRMATIVASAEQHGLAIPQSRLRAALESDNGR
jgi:tagaturonate reductase